MIAEDISKVLSIDTPVLLGELEPLIVLSHLGWYNVYGWHDEDFISIARSLGTKSGRKKFDMCPECPANVAHSSRGLGHLPLKEEITGSNPVCATKYLDFA
jgi:hypothetical protein